MTPSLQRIEQHRERRWQEHLVDIKKRWQANAQVYARRKNGKAGRATQAMPELVFRKEQEC